MSDSLSRAADRLRLVATFIPGFSSSLPVSAGLRHEGECVLQCSFSSLLFVVTVVFSENKKPYSQHGHISISTYKANIDK